MNAWKPLAVLSTSALIIVVGYEGASATPPDRHPSSVDGDYRRMRAAIESLRAAREHLANAEHDHGGWRERAIEATDHAIHDTEEGMKWNP
jgi:hypothetical protein